jgi:hypothetical protein
MARSQRPKSASTNKRGVAAEDVNAALGRYLRDLERSPLAVRTRDAYGQHCPRVCCLNVRRPAGLLSFCPGEMREAAAR